MPRITISYRRDDSDVITGRIFDRLSAHYGRETVFRDIDSIPLGVDFRKHVNSVIDGTDIMVAVVGPKWIGPRAGQSRLDNAADPVRVEVDAALRKGVPLIPVLVLRAQMPRADQLPPSLEDFAYRNAARIDAGQDFDTHMARLIRAIDNLLEEKSAARDGAPPSASSPTAPTAEDDQQKRFDEQLQREEEERQRQVAEDHQREIAEARRLQEEEQRQQLPEEHRVQEERAAVAPRERVERERLEAVRHPEQQAHDAQGRMLAAGQAAEVVPEETERQTIQQLPASATPPPAQPGIKLKVKIGLGLGGLAIAAVVAILVISHLGPVPNPRPPPSPPSPTPQAQPQPQPQPTTPPQQSPAPQSATINLAPGQVWSLTFSDKSNTLFTGVLTIDKAASYNSFTGIVEISFQDTGGNVKTVRETALVTINSPKITIACSNVSFLKGSGPYTADYFDFTIKSSTLAEGTNFNNNFNANTRMERD